MRPHRSPVTHRRALLVRADGAESSRELLEWLTAQGQVRVRRVEYSVRYVVTDQIRGAIKLVAKATWTPASAAGGGVCDAGFVAEMTGLLDLSGWPEGMRVIVQTVRTVLYQLMAANGWKGASDWAKRANRVAPTIVGGSKKHGGPDLGPTRAKREWATLGVDGLGVANEAPPSDAPVDFTPKPSDEMVARIQGWAGNGVCVGLR